MNGFEVEKSDVQYSSYQIIDYVLMRLVGVATLDSILALNFDKPSRLDAFMETIAHYVADNPKFLEPITMRVLDRAAKVAERDKMSNPHDRRRSMSPLPVDDHGL